MGNLCLGRSKKDAVIPNSPAWLSEAGLNAPSYLDIKKVYKLSGDALGDSHNGSVCVGYERSTKERVAIKKCSKQLILQQQHGKTSKLSEIEILQKAQEGDGCPQILRLLAVFEDQDNIYLVTEFCGGGDLYASIASRATFTEADAAVIGRQILEALAHLHGHGITYGHLNPENIAFVNSTSQDLKLVDLGRASFIAPVQHSHDTLSSSFYMAPEVHARKVSGPAADMWSFGAILYVMLSGLPSSPTSTDLEGNPTWLKLQAGEFTRLPERTSPVLEDLLFKLLTPDMKARLTAEQALEHPWLFGTTSYASASLHNSLSYMKDMVAERDRLQKSSKYYVYRSDANKAEALASSSQKLYVQDQCGGRSSRNMTVVSPTVTWRSTWGAEDDIDDTASSKSKSLRKVHVEVLEPQCKRKRRTKMSGFKELVSCQNHRQLSGVR